MRIAPLTATLAGSVALAALLVSAPAESRRVLTPDGGYAGSIVDGTYGDGGGTPSVLPLPNHPTLEDLVIRANTCTTGPFRALFFFYLVFGPDGRVREMKPLGENKLAPCVRKVFQGAMVQPFTGGVRTVEITVRTH